MLKPKMKRLKTIKPSLEVAPTTLAQRTRQNNKLVVTHLQFQIPVSLLSLFNHGRLISPRKVRQ